MIKRFCRPVCFQDYTQSSKAAFLKTVDRCPYVLQFLLIGFTGDHSGSFSVAFHRLNLCVMQNRFGKMHDFPGGTVAGIQLRKLRILIYCPQISQGMGMIRI